MNIHHVLNPSDIGTTDYFRIESYSPNNYLQDGTYTIPGVHITNEIDVGEISYVSFSAVPSNGSQVADYTITFTP